MELTDFKKYCKHIDPNTLVQRYIIEGASYFFDKYYSGDEFEFKKAVSETLKVHIRDIVIVGSGKLGFSLKPENDDTSVPLFKFKVFDHDFQRDTQSQKSDLDVAIVSPRLFDRELENLLDHTESYKNFIGPNRTDFAKFILKGRFITDYLPKDFPLTKEINSVQSNFKMKYAREISLEIYKSWFFFETYHRNNIQRIQLNLIA